jgi:hypothetical protein
MDQSQENRVSIGEAIARVGAAIYGADWINGFSERERWLIETYVGASARPCRERIGTQHTRYGVSDRPWNMVPTDPKLISEIERAYDRLLWSDRQCNRILDWLDSHGFDWDESDFDADALTNELAKELPSAAIDVSRQDGSPNVAPTSIGRTPPIPSARSKLDAAEASATEIARRYIAEQRAAKRKPTQSGMLDSVKGANLGFGRDLLKSAYRAAYRDSMGEEVPGPGRPKSQN